MYSTESTNIDTVLTLERSVYLLEQFQNLNYPKRAIDNLEQKGNEYRLLALYRQLFCEDWNASSASYYSHHGNSQWSKRTTEFLQLIDRRLFPLDLDRDTSAWDENNLLTIPITSMGMGRVEMYQMSYSDLDRGIKLLLPLSRSGRDYLECWSSEEADEILSFWYQENTIESSSFDLTKLTHPDNINYKYLRRLCSTTNSLIKFLPLALRFIDLDTDNVWLDEPGYDFDADDCTQFTFSYQNILFLQREWTKAQAIANAVFSLVDWLEGDDSRFTEILELWQKASINHN
jgi:hypothetical protein